MDQMTFGILTLFNRFIASRLTFNLLKCILYKQPKGLLPVFLQVHHAAGQASI